MNSSHLSRHHLFGRTIVLAMTLLMLASLFGCSSLKEHILMKDAAKAYKAQKFDEAAKDFEAALKLNPDREVNWKYLGYCYWSLITPGSTSQKDVDYSRKCLDAFQHYLSLHGQDDSIQDFMINIYINQNMLDEGIKYYQAQLKLHPDDARIMTTLSKMYATKDDFQNSYKYSLMKANLTPGDISGWQYIGALCWNRSYNEVDPAEERNQIVDDGISALTKALEIDNNNFNAHLFMNLLYREKQKIAQLQADDTNNWKKKRELLQKANEYLKKADEERNIAIAIKEGNTGNSEQPGGEASPAAESGN